MAPNSEDSAEYKQVEQQQQQEDTINNKRRLQREAAERRAKEQRNDLMVLSNEDKKTMDANSHHEQTVVDNNNNNNDKDNDDDDNVSVEVESNYTYSDYASDDYEDEDGVGMYGGGDKNNNNNEGVDFVAENSVSFRDLDNVRLSMMQITNKTADVLAVSPSAAMVLLRNHQWDTNYLQSLYFDKKEEILKSCGIYNRVMNDTTNNNSTVEIGEGKTINNCGGRLIQQHQCTNQTACIVCGDNDIDYLYSLGCSHLSCRDCWVGHIKSQISDGPGCIQSCRCMQHQCNELVTRDEVNFFLSDNDDETNMIRDKYELYEITSYVDLNKFMRWCPGTPCDRVATVSSSLGIMKGIAKCLCDTEFCLSCGKEPHAPALCNDLDRWERKLAADGESSSYIKVNTKPCPKCKSNIEKNMGCNHMTCSRCCHEFCWICLGDRKHHGTHVCNTYNDIDGKNAANQTREELNRFVHYFDRYTAHKVGQDYAQDKLRNIMYVLENESTLSERLDMSSYNNRLKVVLEELISCRRLLKHTYAAGYYFMTNKQRNKNKRKSNSLLLFENYQGQLENFTERLSEQSEKSITEFNGMVANELAVAVRKYVKNITDLDLHNDNDDDDDENEDNGSGGVDSTAFAPNATAITSSNNRTTTATTAIFYHDYGFASSAREVRNNVQYGTNEEIENAMIAEAIQQSMNNIENAMIAEAMSRSMKE